jgi:O-antigen/teichoic acid export membrane protein
MGVIQRQGIKSTIITYTGIFIGFLSLLVIQPQLLSPEIIGLTRILYSFSFLVSTVVPLSIVNITTRFFPRFRSPEKKHHGYFGFMLVWLAAGSLLFLPILWIFKSYFISIYTENSHLFSEYFIFVLPLTLVIASISIISNYLFSIFRPILPAFAQEVFIRLLFILIIVFYAAGYLNLNQFVYSFIGTYILQLIVLLVYVFKRGDISFRINTNIFNKKVIIEMLNYGWMVFLAGIASMAIKLLDTIVLGQFVSLALVGVYGIAAFIPTFIEAPLNALDKVANARIAYSWEKNDLENIKEIYYKSSRYLFLLGGFLFLMVTINTPHLFQFLPFEFKSGIPVVGILSLSALFNLMTGSNNAIIYTSNRFASGTIALVSITCINLVLLYLLIPPYGIIGAAWATCISSFLYNAFKYVYIWIRFKLQPFDKRTIFIAVSIALTYGTMQFVPLLENVILNIVLHSLLVTLCFTVLIWFSRSAEDLKQLLPFFKNKE